MCPIAVATLFGRYLMTRCTLSPGHDWKYPFGIALMHVDLTSLNDGAWRHFTKKNDFSFGMHCLYYILGLCQFADCRLGFPRVLSIVLLLSPLLLLGPLVLKYDVDVCIGEDRLAS